MYRIAWFFCLCVLKVFFRYRVNDVDRVPKTGGVLLVTNHASFLDPLVAGCGIRRKVTFIARGSLNDSRLYRFLTIPADLVHVKRGEGDRGALRAAVDALGAGKLIVMFPEGTRTRDGSLGPLKAGFAVIARQAGVPVVPAWLSGTFAAWPRHRRLPRFFRRVEVHYGPPLTFREDETREESIARVEAALKSLAGGAGLRAGDARESRDART